MYNLRGVHLLFFFSDPVNTDCVTIHTLLVVLKNITTNLNLLYIYKYISFFEGVVNACDVIRTYVSVL